MKASTISFLAIGLVFAGAVASAQEGTSEPAAPSAPSNELTVAEVVIATGVEDHEPVSPGTSFQKGSTSLVCFVRVENGPRVASEIFVTWERAEGEPAEATGRGVRLEVPAQRRMRTFIRGSSNRTPGPWRCVVRAQDGHVLGHADFQITE